MLNLVNALKGLMSVINLPSDAGLDASLHRGPAERIGIRIRDHAIFPGELSSHRDGGGTRRRDPDRQHRDRRPRYGTSPPQNRNNPFHHCAHSPALESSWPSAWRAGLPRCLGGIDL